MTIPPDHNPARFPFLPNPFSTRYNPDWRDGQGHNFRRVRRSRRHSKWT